MNQKIKNDGTLKTRLIISANQDKYENFRAVFNLCDTKTISHVCDFYRVDKGMAKAHVCRRIYTNGQKAELEIL